MSTPSFFKTHPRLCLMVLAASKGSRLYPMTSSDMPKHLMPIAGIPCILRLLEHMAHISQVVVVVSPEDSKTLSVLQTIATLRPEDATEATEEEPSETWTLDVKTRPQTITLLKLNEGCFGPVDALRTVEETKIVHPSTRMLVVPGDLVFLQKGINLDQLLQPTSKTDCTALLVEVGEVDEHGVPLKESSKAKKGGFARDEDDIEYIGLSYSSSTDSNNGSALPRIVLKQSKLDVEADEDMTGSTSKLQVPKARLRTGRLVVKTSWNDIHVYSLAPWVRQLLVARRELSSFQEDLIPLLVSRQFRGKKATFGRSLQKDRNEDGTEKENTDATPEVDEEPFSMLGLVLSGKTVLRANTISAYHYACRETVVNGSLLTMPPDSKWNGKFQTLVLQDSKLGAKINMKSSVIGKGCQLGAKSRLNNVIIMDNAIIGENCSLQNTLIGSGVKLGNNCSLNDCQVGPGKEIPAGTKEKGESFTVDDAMEDDVL